MKPITNPKYYFMFSHGHDVHYDVHGHDVHYDVHGHDVHYDSGASAELCDRGCLETASSQVRSRAGYNYVYRTLLANNLSS